LVAASDLGLVRLEDASLACGFDRDLAVRHEHVPAGIGALVEQASLDVEVIDLLNLDPRAGQAFEQPVDRPEIGPVAARVHAQRRLVRHTCPAAATSRDVAPAASS